MRVGNQEGINSGGSGSRPGGHRRPLGRRLVVRAGLNALAFTGGGVSAMANASEGSAGNSYGRQDSNDNFGPGSKVIVAVLTTIGITGRSFRCICHG